MDQLRFDGLSVIVTGAGRGFGRSHALLFASRGAKVVVADNGCDIDGRGSSREPAQQVVEEIKAAGGEAVACFESVADPAGATTIVDTALYSFGRLDIVVNNAGIADPHWFEDTSDTQLQRMLDTHYNGTVQVSKAAWPYLQNAHHGVIVNTSSEGIVGHIPKMVPYAGAKGGVFAFTRALAFDGRRLGIRVNAIAPRGMTRMSDAKLLSQVYDRAEAELENPSLIDTHRPEYVSAGVVYLAHSSCQLNGEVLVCGGGTVHRLLLTKTRGAAFDNITPEAIAADIDRVLDETGAIVQTLDSTV